MKQSHIKCLFAVKLVKAMNDFSILINIDETLFSRTTRPIYSWLERGKEWSIGNIWCTNSTSLITSITSTGSIYASSISDSAKGSTIFDYFQGLKEFIQDKLKIDIRRWLILFDNAPTHRSKVVKEFIKEESLSVVFIPAYSPELAPIEKYFALLKRIVTRKAWKDEVNWKKEESMVIIKRATQSIPCKIISNIWRYFMDELRGTIDQVRTLT